MTTMATSKIGVGIVGVSADRGWASVAHLPALAQLDGYEVRALSSRTADGARRAAEKYGVAAAFDNAFELAARRDVDLVVVTVKVTDHLEPVLAALEAGKMVLCEWPLGPTLADARRMADRADELGLRTAIGLQARFSPEIRYLKQLVQAGQIGRVLGSTMVGTALAWGRAVDPANEYLMDAANGATVLSIPCAHALDPMCDALGEFQTVSAILANRRGETRRTTDGATIPMTTPDEVAIIGRLGDGAPASVRYRGGRSTGPDFLWEVNGTDGDLQLVVESGQLQAAPLKLRGRLANDRQVRDLEPPPELRLAPAGTPAGPPQNVAALYAQLAADIRSGGSETPGFRHAVKRHELLDAIMIADRTNTAVSFP
jgi:predicted dehydrogenase